MVRLIESPRHPTEKATRVPRADPVAAAAPLRSFEVTADSVVVTLVLEFEKSHRSVKVHWGDDAVESIDLRNVPVSAGQNVPPGTLRLQHAYDVETVPSRVTVFALTRDVDGGRTLNAASVAIRPRYFIVQAPVRVDIAEKDVQIFEGYTHEFDISQRVFQAGRGELVARSWRLEAKIGGFLEGSIGPWVYELEDSALALHMGWEDEPLHYSFDVEEDDGAWGTAKELWELLSDLPVEFDTSTVVGPTLHPRHLPRARHSSTTWRLRRDVVDGRIDVLVTFDATLEVPLDRGPQLKQ